MYLGQQNQEDNTKNTMLWPKDIQISSTTTCRLSNEFSSTTTTSSSCKNLSSRHHGALSSSPIKESLEEGGGETTTTTSNAGIPTIAPFIQRLVRILEQEDPSIIRWANDGKALMICDAQQFTQIVLPLYFRHQNLHSFQRQLNYFGFRKKSSRTTSPKRPPPSDNASSRSTSPKGGDTWTIFHHPFFQKDKPDLWPRIQRRMPNRGRKGSDGAINRLITRPTVPRVRFHSAEEYGSTGMNMMTPRGGFMDALQSSKEAEMWTAFQYPTKPQGLNMGEGLNVATNNQIEDQQPFQEPMVVSPVAVPSTATTPTTSSMGVHGNNQQQYQQHHETEALYDSLMLSSYFPSVDMGMATNGATVSSTIPPVFSSSIGEPMPFMQGILTGPPPIPTAILSGTGPRMPSLSYQSLHYPSSTIPALQLEDPRRKRS